VEKLSESKDKYYFLFKNKIFYSDAKYKYRLSINGDIKLNSFNKIDLFLDKDSYDEILSIFNPYSNHTYTNIEKSDIIVYDLNNKLTYLYYGCFFESVSIVFLDQNDDVVDGYISVNSDYMKIIEDPDLIKSDIRDYKLNNLLDDYIEQL